MIRGINDPPNAGIVDMRGARGLAQRLHAWLVRAPSARSRSDADLAAKVRASFISSYRTYGARRVWHGLLAEGLSCGLHWVERLMRLHALKARPRRRGLPKDDGQRSVIATMSSIASSGRGTGPCSPPPALRTSRRKTSSRPQGRSTRPSRGNTCRALPADRSLEPITSAYLLIGCFWGKCEVDPPHRTTTSKTALLDAAEDALRARLRRLQLRGSDRLVGIRKASIHHHFPTKAALALVLIERYSTVHRARSPQQGSAREARRLLCRERRVACGRVLDRGTGRHDRRLLRLRLRGRRLPCSGARGAIVGAGSGGRGAVRRRNAGVARADTGLTVSGMCRTHPAHVPSPLARLHPRPGLLERPVHPVFLC